MALQDCLHFAYTCPQNLLGDTMRLDTVGAGLSLGLAAAVTAAPQAIDAKASASCVTTTYASAVPTATALALHALSYCGGTLYVDAYIEVSLLAASN